MKHYIVHFNDAEERYYFEKMVAILNDKLELIPTRK